MAQYGAFKFGSTTYGVTTDNNLHYGLEVDWDGDGVFNGVNEAYTRMIAFTTERGRDFYLRQSDEGGFERHRVGRATITLQNEDNRYNANSTDSPLSPNIDRGKYAKFYVMDGAGSPTSDNYHIIAGKIEDIRPIGSGENSRVKIVITDGRKTLQKEVNVALTTDVSVDTAIGTILDNIEWPTIWGRDLGAGSDTIGYWWEDGRSSMLAIDDLADSELGRVYVAGDGKLTFRNRHVVDDSVVTFNEEQILSDIGTTQPWEAQRNKITIKVLPRNVQATAELWRLQDTPIVLGNSSISVWAEYTSGGIEVPAENVLTPVATSDYTFNTNSDGSGVDATSDFTVALASFGSRGKLTLTNNGSAEAYPTLLLINGDPITAPDANYIEAGSGDREFKFELPWQQDTGFAIDLANFLATFLATNTPFPTIMIEARPSLQFAADLTQKVTLAAATLGINTTFRVGSIKHESLDEKCQAVKTILQLEPFPDLSGFWQFPTSKGVSSIFGW